MWNVKQCGRAKCQFSTRSIAVFTQARGAHLSKWWKSLHFIEDQLGCFHAKCEIILTSNYIPFRVLVFIAAINFVCHSRACAHFMHSSNWLPNRYRHSNCIANKNSPFDWAFNFMWKVKAFPLFFISVYELNFHGSAF